MVASSISLKLASLYFRHFLFFASDLILSLSLSLSRLSLFLAHAHLLSLIFFPLLSLGWLLTPFRPIHCLCQPRDQPADRPASQPANQPLQIQPSTLQPDYTRGGNFTSPIHLYFAASFKCRRRDLSRDPIRTHVRTNVYAIVRLLHGYTGPVRGRG